MAEIEDSSGDEFELELSTLKDPLALLERVREFTYYFVENVELNLNFCLFLLEERDVPAKQNTIHTTVLSKILSAIPKAGSAVGGILSKGEIMVLQKIDKKNSRTLADLVYYFSDHKEEIRTLLIESAVDIFYSFEDQFTKLTCNGGQKRAMQKLARDASDRIFNYFLEHEQKKDVTRMEFVKGVILGDSRRNRGLKKEGKTVMHDDVKWKTCKMYRKVGIVLVEEGLFFKNAETKPEKYGYRRPFSWETPADIKNDWEPDTCSKLPHYTLQVKEDLLTSIADYIKTKNPNERAQLERERFNKQALEDRKEKHKEILQTFDENFKDLLRDLEDQYTYVSGNFRENKEILYEVSKKQDEGNNTQIEIKTKLEEIHRDVNETKEGQTVLIETNKTIQNEVVVIKTNQEEICNTLANVPNKESIKEIVKTEAREDTKDAVKELIRDTLRQNDPGPAIKETIEKTTERVSNEVERSAKKVENEVRRFFGRF